MLETDVRDPCDMASDFAKLILYPEKVPNVEMSGSGREKRFVVVIKISIRHPCKEYFYTPSLQQEYQILEHSALLLGPVAQ